MRTAIFSLAVAGLVLGVAVGQAAVLESPARGAALSGLGFISGWKCEASAITVTVNGGEHLSVAMHQERGDLRAVCGGTIRHGFIMQFNWNLVGDGAHEVVAYDAGVEFGRATFTVGTTGEEFLRDARRRSLIENFPSIGEDTLVKWNESTQHFEILTVFESPVRSVYDREWWRQYNHDARVGTYATEEFLYAALPDVAACEPGELSVGARNRALVAANQIRALHGLSAVKYSTGYNEQVQATALLGAANTTPLPPATPAFACYAEEGAAGAQESLLWDIAGHVDPVLHLAGWMAGSSVTRRWAIDPFATDFAYGQVGGYGVYKVLGYDHEPYQVPPIAVDFVAYPFEFYPFNLVAFDPPWSFHVVEDTDDPQGNRGDYFSRASITVRRMSDDVALRVTDIASDPPGVANFLSWRVEGWAFDTPYEVAIRGVTMQDGSTRDYRYFVVVERETLAVE